MHIEDQVIAGIESPGHALRLNQHRRVRLPKQKIAIGIKLVARIHFQLHPGNTVFPFRRVRTAKRCGAIDEDVGVMNDLRRGRADLHGANVMRLLERIGQNEVAKDVGSGGSQSKRAFHRQDQIRSAVLPGIAVLGRGRRCGRIALCHPGLHPFGDQRYLVVGEPPLICKVSVAMFREPGRHVARRGDGSHLRAPAPGILIGQQAERAGTAGMVTRGAVVVDQRRDLVRPGDGRVLRCGGSFACPKPHRQNQPPDPTHFFMVAASQSSSQWADLQAAELAYRQARRGWLLRGRDAWLAAALFPGIGTGHRSAPGIPRAVPLPRE